MSVFGGLMLTNSGRNLEAKAQLGKALKFKRIALGDGQITTESMITMTSLINEVLSAEITGMQITKDNIVTITFYLTNQNLEKGFTWRELGVIAEDPDTKEEILYNYGNARQNAEYICGANEQDILELNVSIDLIVSNVENVTASIDNSLVFATKRELNDLKNTKVDKEEGKRLMTDEEGTKLANLSNYDDTQIKQTINAKADTKKMYEKWVNPANWIGENAPYTQTITVEGIEENDIVNIYLVQSTDVDIRKRERKDYNNISFVTSSKDSITLTCDEEKTSMWITIRIEVTY